MKDDADTGSSVTGDLPGDRSERIQSLVYDFLSRSDGGEHVSRESLQSQHPDLMPELSQALLAGSRKLRLLLQASRARQSSDPDAFNHERPTPRIPGYTVVQEISGGGQGTVYEAIHELTGRTVALKLMAAVSRHSVTRFDREARAMATIDHPGVVKIIDQGRTDLGSCFLAMDYIAGDDLDAWTQCQAGNQQGQIKVIQLFIRICSALGAAHAVGVVHRDLKPSNVRVDELGDPHVVDFGLACFSDVSERALTITGNIVGSVPWSSPEQAGGQSAYVTPRSDVYSIGVLLYQALTGQFPYPVDGPLHAVTKSICTAAPLNPQKIARAPFGPISEPLAHMLLTFLSKDPANRPADGAAAAEALRRYLSGDYTLPKRHIARGQEVLAATVLAVVVVGFLIWRWMPSSPPVLVLKLPSFINSVGMEMIQLPAGSYRMGTLNDDPGFLENEQAHKVRISAPLHMSKTEVTREQYHRVMGISLATGEPTTPMVGITRAEAMQFCQRLGQMEGREYRLPSEAEWEYACRAGTTSSFAGSGNVADVAWFGGNTGGAARPVGTRLPNQWGLCDMHGNVSEWVLDGYVPRLGQADVTDPIRGDAGTSGVLRGGNASLPAEFCRSAFRASVSPTHQDDLTGFRVVAQASTRQN